MKKIKISKIVTGGVIIFSPVICSIFSMNTSKYLSPMYEVYFTLKVLALIAGALLIGSSFWESDDTKTQR